MRSGLSPRLRAIDGKAVLTIVESSVCMKNPTATTQSMMRSLGSWGMAADSTGGVARDMAAARV
jgi:hypothetical protein